MRSADQCLEQHDWTILQCGKRQLALPSVAVIRSINSPAMHSLPFSPDHVPGVCHVDGMVIPCVDLNCLLGESVSAEDREAVLVTHDGRHAVILIDRAIRQIQMDEETREQLTVLDSEGDDTDANAVIAEANLDGRSLLLLDPAPLCRFSARQAAAGARPGLVAEARMGADLAGDQEEQDLLLFFRLGQQRFAVPVQACRELFPLTDINPVPGAPRGIRGLTLLRGHSLLVLDTASLLDIESDHEQAGLLIGQGDSVWALSISEIENVRPVPRRFVRAVGTGTSATEAVIEEPGKALAAVVSLANLASRIDGLHRFLPESRLEEVAEQVTLRSFLVLNWQSERFALPLTDIERLLPPQPLKTCHSDALEGMISLEGQAIPVLEPGQFYGSASNNQDIEGFTVINRSGLRYAVSMESAEGIIHVPESRIQTSRAASDQRFAGTVQDGDALLTLVCLDAHQDSVASAAEAQP